MLEADRLTKEYGSFAAARDVSFTAHRGSIVGLLGPNGAGKSTVMRMLTGYLAPTSGRAVVAGCDVQTDRLRAAARIGYLPENGPLYADMTPLEMLRFFGEARGLDSATLKSRIDAVAAQCAIGAILDKSMGKLSKGLRQRAGMAQALLHDPDVLILDEPTAGLDPIQVEHFRRHIAGLKANKTVLLSTHILQDVEAIADRVLIMHEGRLVLDASMTAVGGSGLHQRFLELTGESMAPAMPLRVRAEAIPREGPQ
jgi:ABC-2 type transport system ATP-binding protein